MCPNCLARALQAEEFLVVSECEFVDDEPPGSDEQIDLGKPDGSLAGFRLIASLVTYLNQRAS